MSLKRAFTLLITVSLSEDGDVFVVKTGPKYELLSTNPVGEVMMASAAISDGLIIVRGVKHLFAFGEAANQRSRN
jgi:hypothetical protein